MSDALDRALSESKNFSDVTTERALLRAASIAGGEASLVAGIASRGDSSGAGTLGRPTSLAQHAEQYRHNVGWVYACIRVIAQRIARQPLRVARYARKLPDPVLDRANYNRPRRKSVPYPYKAYAADIDILEDHEFLRVMERPNEIMTRWAMIFTTVVSLELTGKAYWWIYEADENSPLAGRKVVWPVPSSWMEPKHSMTRIYDKWIMRVEGTHEPVLIPGNQIVYFYYPDASNPLAAVSPLQAAARSVVADEAIAEAQRRAFANGIWPGMAVIVGRNPDLKAAGVPDVRPVLNRSQRAQITAAIKAAYRGVQHYDEPLILDGLIEDVKRISSTNREMDFLASGSYTKERITQIFGVNPVVMGQIEGANRATAVAAELHMLDNTVNPKIELISEQMTTYVAPHFRSSEGERLLVYVEEAQASDPDNDRQDRAQLREAGGIAINEMRTDLGYPPIHGGDVILVNSGLVPVHVVREDDPEPEGPARLPGEGDTEESLPPSGLPPAMASTPDGHRASAEAAPERSDRAGSLPAVRALPFALRAARTLQRYGGEYRSVALKAGKDNGVVVFRAQHEAGERAMTVALARVSMMLGAKVSVAIKLAEEGGLYVGGHLVAEAIADRDGAEQYKAAVAPIVKELTAAAAVLEWDLHRPRTAREMSSSISALLAGPTGIPLVDRLPDAVRVRVEAAEAEAINGYWLRSLPRTLRDEITRAVEAARAAGKKGQAMLDEVEKVAGAEGSLLRAARVARKETTAALNAGQYASQLELYDMGLARSKEWAAVLDDVTREAHRHANGQVQDIKTPFRVGGESCDYPGQDSLSPGNRINCRCTTITITIAEDAGSALIQPSEGGDAGDRDGERGGAVVQPHADQIVNAHNLQVMPRTTTEQCDAWGRKLTPLEGVESDAALQAIDDYGNAEHERINGALRGKDDGDEGTRRRAKQLDRVIGKYPLPHDVVIVRTMYLDAYDGAPESMVGKVLTDGGFLSGSVSPEFRSAALERTWNDPGHRKPAVVEITVPAGTPGVYISHVTGAKEEAEMLIARGARIQIDSVSKQGDGYLIRARLLSVGAAGKSAAARRAARSIKFAWVAGDISWEGGHPA